jgi:hypothetical protein
VENYGLYLHNDREARSSFQASSFPTRRKPWPAPQDRKYSFSTTNSPEVFLRIRNVLHALAGSTKFTDEKPSLLGINGDNRLHPCVSHRQSRAAQ